MERTPLTPIRNPVVVQPVLTFHIPKKREATSWREWGGLMTDQVVTEERNRIQKELSELSTSADFPLKVLRLEAVQTTEEAASVARGQHDVLLMYAAGGSTQLLEALTDPKKWNLMFLRHRSGPVYLWYEIVHPRYLRKTVDEYGQSGMDVQDVVVDDPKAVLWRLRALQGLKNTLGKRIVAVGGAGGWGEGGARAPERTRELWKMDLQEFPYKELARRIQGARENAGLIRNCLADSERYLGQNGVTLLTTGEFVANAFLLTEILKALMTEAETDAITINSCMNTIMPMSQTTACLALSLLNDAGYMAFCESDFVVIPSGVLLHYLSGKPVFLNDPTYPHDQLVTLAHCTAPRRMDGKRLEAAKILTHFESDYGAAPKVEMRVGQTVTNLIPDFASRHWVGFRGTIVANPNLDICRSQIDVEIHGDQSQLLKEMKGFHWMTCYGDYLEETGFALRKVGVDWHDLSIPQNSSKQESTTA
jgi:L-fucose isomerase-like protein